MLNIFLAIAAAYLVGLAVMGGVFVLGLLQIQRERGKLSGLTMAILWGLHGCLTISGILVVATLHGVYRADVTEEMRFAFAITGLVMLGLFFAVIKEWNRLLLKEKRP